VLKDEKRFSFAFSGQLNTVLLNSIYGKMRPQLNELRALLKERFPQAHAAGRSAHDAVVKTTAVETTAVATSPPREVLVTAQEVLHPAPGTFTEVTSPLSGYGSILTLTGLLLKSLGRSHPTALVDGKDSFEPTTLPAALMPFLLWVRCRNLGEALRATDILVQDGNLPIVVLDLQLIPESELRQTPGSTWQRLRMTTAQSHVSLVAFTPCQTISAAHIRFALQQRSSLDLLERPMHEALGEIKAHRVTRRSGSSPALP
jgi:hypothetical protein